MKPLSAVMVWAVASVVAACSGSTRGIHSGGGGTGGGAASGGAGGSAGAAGNACSGSGWGAPVIIRDGIPTFTTPTQVQTAVIDSGMAVVVWGEYRDPPFPELPSTQVMAAVCRGGFWMAATPIGPAISRDPVLAVRPDGTAVIAWGEQLITGPSTVGATTLWAAFLDPAAGTWGPPMRVGAPAGNASPSAIAAAADGTAQVVWAENGSVWASRYNGSAWEPPTALSGGEIGGGNADIVGGDASDRYLAVWEEVDTSTSPWTYRIFARRYSGGAWGAPALIVAGTVTLSTPALGPGGARLASNAPGDAVVGWYQQDGLVTSLQSAAFSGSANRWTAAAPIAVGGSNLAVTIDSASRGIATWQTPVQGDGAALPDQHLAWSDPATGAWQDAQAVEKGNNVWLGSDARGNTWRVWTSGYYDTNDITQWAARYDPVNGAGAPTPIWRPSGYEAPALLSLSVSPNGRALTAMAIAGITGATFYGRIWTVMYNPN